MQPRKARIDAVRHYIARRSEVEWGEIGEPERRGWRELHIRQSAGEIIEETARDLTERNLNPMNPGYSKILREELAKRGFRSVKMKDVCDALGGKYAEWNEEEDTETEDDDGSEVLSHDYQVERFPAEYVSFSDFSLLMRVNVQFADEDFLNGLIRDGTNTFYQSREADQTWGIFLDMDTLLNQLNDVEKHWGIEECRKFLLWNLYHEYFHYMTEVACWNINPGEEGCENKSCEKFDDYRHRTEWGQWDCALSDCCRIGPVGVRGVPEYRFSAKECECIEKFGYSLPNANHGYQYPLEEAMANAYAIERLEKIDGLDPALVTDYIDQNPRLGYSDYSHYRSRTGLALGKRILTRMLQGMRPPRVNILQHMLLDEVPGGLDSVREYEGRVFSHSLSNDAYRNIKSIENVPVHILGWKDQKKKEDGTIENSKHDSHITKLVKRVLSEAGLI
ncbi:MAG: hypothetical protein VCB99_00360 [Myxococcota bacterium]